MYYKYLAFLLSVSLVSTMTGCSELIPDIGQQGDSSAQERAFSSAELEDIIVEEIIEAEIFREAPQTDGVTKVYHHTVNNSMTATSNVMELTVTPEITAELYRRLPEAVTSYEVDWEGVTSKFAVGTGIYLIYGVIDTAINFENPLYYVFAVADVAQGVLDGSVQEGVKLASHVLLSSHDGIVNESAQKYQIEDAASSYLNNAVSNVMWGTVSNVVRIDNPVIDKLGEWAFDKLYDITGVQIGTVGKAGEVLDMSGNLRDEYIYTLNNTAYLTDNKGNVLSCYDMSGHEMQEVPKLPKLSEIRKTSGADVYFTVDSDKIVSYQGEEIGYLNSFNAIVGIHDYEGQLIGRADSDGNLIQDNWKVMQAGIRFSKKGTIINDMHSLDKTEQTAHEDCHYAYLDSAGNVIAYAKETAEGRFLIDSDGTIIGILDDYLHLAYDVTSAGGTV